MSASVPRTVAFVIRGPIRRGDLPGLCERVCALLEASAASRVVCDVTSVAPDAVTVEALARLQLASHRHGCVVELRGAGVDLRDLIAFMGLDRVLPG